MKEHTSNNLPPAHTLRTYMDTSRKRQLVDLWLAQAMALVQRFLRGEETNEGYFSRTTLLWARTICRMEKNIRECENFNHNLRIRAYVLMTKSGKAWARGVLGEANIKRWQAKYDACRKTGFVPKKKAKSKAKARPAPVRRKAPSSYNWKPISLPSLSYWFFPRLDFSFPELPDPFAKQVFIWPREKRALKPAEIWPYMLKDGYAPDRNEVFCDEQSSYERVAREPAPDEPPQPPPNSKPP